jgi:hypothetical protein
MNVFIPASRSSLVLRGNKRERSFPVSISVILVGIGLGPTSTKGIPLTSLRTCDIAGWLEDDVVSGSSSAFLFLYPAFGIPSVAAFDWKKSNSNQIPHRIALPRIQSSIYWPASTR